MAEKEDKYRDPSDIDKSSIDEVKSEPSVAIECAVCLQNCVYPVQLPCKHIFCFLCVKGVTLQSRRCAMCRQAVPPEYLDHPDLISHLDLTREESGFEDGGQWFYEGRNGWWLYDERTSEDIEGFWSRGEKRCELLIAGWLYIVDFEHMLQYRRNDPSRRRRIKRDAASGPKKGVAGIRIEGAEESEDVENTEVGDDSSGDNDNSNEVTDDLVAGISSLAVSDSGIVTRTQLQSQNDSQTLSTSDQSTLEGQSVPLPVESEEVVVNESYRTAVESEEE